MAQLTGAYLYPGYIGVALGLYSLGPARGIIKGIVEPLFVGSIRTGQQLCILEYPEHLANRNDMHRCRLWAFV